MGRWIGADRTPSVTGEEGYGDEGSLADLMQLAEERIAMVALVSRSAADQIRSEVETDLDSSPDPDADPMSREGLVEELTRTLVERAEALAAEAEELSGILRRAGRQLAGRDVRAPAPPSREGPPTPPTGSGADPSTANEQSASRFIGRAGRLGGSRSGPSGERPVSDGMRLLATQMAVAGSSRGEIELHLRRGLDVSDASSILTDVLGPGSR